MALAMELSSRACRKSGSIALHCSHCVLRMSELVSEPGLVPNTGRKQQSSHRQRWHLAAAAGFPIKSQKPDIGRAARPSLHKHYQPLTKQPGPDKPTSEPLQHCLPFSLLTEARRSCARGAVVCGCCGGNYSGGGRSGEWRSLLATSCTLGLGFKLARIACPTSIGAFRCSCSAAGQACSLRQAETCRKTGYDRRNGHFRASCISIQNAPQLPLVFV